MLLNSSSNPNTQALSCDNLQARDDYPAKDYLHESFDVFDQNRYARGYFGWPNVYYAEWINDIAPKVTQLIGKHHHDNHQTTS